MASSRPRSRTPIIAAALCAAAISIAATYLITKHHYENLLAQAHPIFVPSTPYKLLHPIVGIALPGDQYENGLPDVASGIANIIAAQPPSTLTRYAFYLRDLNSGNWTGVHENDQYDPASLLKVVVAIAAYRQGEENPSYLTTPLTYTSAIAQINTQLPFAQPAELVVGHSYSVPDLIAKELVDSDNGAVYTLLNSINQSVLDEVYQELSIPKPSDASSVGYKLTALEYSRFFRILYNGTLDLSWAHSEAILEDLSKSTFTSGLAAGVPSGVAVAHKFGEHVNGSGGVATSVELSDCGIIYDPVHPYFLCVMTEGKDPTTLASVIANISKYVYEHIHSKS